MDRFYYLIALAIELFLSTISFLVAKAEQRTTHNIFPVNIFDFFKSGIWVFIFTIFGIEKCLCEKIIKNYQ